MTELSGFEGAVTRINKIAENLANGASNSKRKAIIELRELCGRHHTVPSIYKLEGVVREGSLAQHTSPVIEIWKGRYKGEEVALKVLRVDRGRADIPRIKSRFCKEVVLMKQADHDNILPFYGVSTSVSDFCLVFPWYGNGNITDYLKGNPTANRYDLLSGAANGLCFLHTNRVVHGALRTSHILIDNGGNARLAIAARSSIVPVPGTSTAAHVPSVQDALIDDLRCSAPEVQWPELYGKDEAHITKESDVYEMAMVIYMVLTGKKPYYNCNENNVLPMVQSGKIPERSSEEIDGLVWELLEKCWSRVPAKRPPTAQVFNTLSSLSSGPQVMHTPEENYATQGSPTQELPGKLKVNFQSIKFSPDQPKKNHFYVELKCGDMNHTTPPTNLVDRAGEHKWSKPEIWEIEANKQYHGHLVSLKVLLRSRWPFGTDEVWATGNFSLFNKVDREIPVQLRAEPDRLGSTTLRIRVVGE